MKMMYKEIGISKMLKSDVENGLEVAALAVASKDFSIGCPLLCVVNKVNNKNALQGTAFTDSTKTTYSSSEMFMKMIRWL